MHSMPFSTKAYLFILAFIISVLTITFSTPGTSNGAALPSEYRALQNGEGEELFSLPTILSSDDTEFLFEVVVPSINKSPFETGAGLFEQIRIPGYGYIGAEGYPDLPQRSFLVAIPPGTVPVATVVREQSHFESGVRVLPATQHRLLHAFSGTPGDIAEFSPEFETTYPIDEQAYSSDQFFPSGPVEVGEVFWIRDRRVVRVFIQPVLANSADQSLKVFTRLTVRVGFNPSGHANNMILESREEGPGFESILRDSILNYEASRQWRLHRDLNSELQTSPCMEGNALRVALDETGMYEIGFATLSANGWPSNIPAEAVRMCYRDEEIAIRILDDNDDGFFNGSDSLIFYGQAIKTQETTTNVYWLTYYTNGGVGKRMAAGASSSGGASLDSYTASYHLETDGNYYSLIPLDDSSDHWFWRDPLSGEPGNPDNSLTASFTLNNIASGSFSASLAVKVWGWNNSLGLAHPDHRFEVLVNDISQDIVDFTGRGVGYLYEGEVDSEDLIDGENTVTIKALEHDGNFHLILVDWINIHPRRQFVAEGDHIAFDIMAEAAQDTTIIAGGFTPGNTQIDIYDVSDPADPTHQEKSAPSGTVSFNRIISGTKSFELSTSASNLIPLSIEADTAPSPLLSDDGNDADMIIITDPALDDALSPLRSLRSSQGHEVVTVFVQDIFDEFSYGLYSTEAIKNFLTYAYGNWSGTREYVLLAGEGSYDHRNLLGLNGPGGNLVPVYLRSGIDRNLGEAAADNQYVDVDGDDLADMLLGRLPANNQAELAIMVDKILTYEAGPTTAPWRASHLFVTDNGLVPSGDECFQDPAADFFAAVDAFIDDYLPEDQLLRRVSYAPPQCYEASEPYYASTVFEMQTGIVQRYNSGSQFVVYTGHSGTRVWGHEGFFDLNLASGVSNDGRTPIMLPMTCLTGIYHFPEGDNLSETLLKLEGRGSVASYAPTGLQVQSGHDYLLQGFYTGVYTDGVRVLGQAVYKAKLSLDSGPSSYQDLHDTFMLLGDPAMRMDLPENLEWNYLPAITK